MRYELELSDNMLRAIGSVSAQWATLEYQMARATVACLTRYQNAPSRHVDSTAFSKRRFAFEEALRWPNVAENIRVEGQALLDRISDLENCRHKVIHGMAESIPKLQPAVLFSRSTDRHWFAEEFTTEQIQKISDQIADLNGDVFIFASNLWLSRVADS